MAGKVWLCVWIAVSPMIAVNMLESLQPIVLQRRLQRTRKRPTRDSPRSISGQ
jgi:hypothetical protein